MTFNISASLGLLLAVAVGPASPQNQTSANAPPPPPPVTWTDPSTGLMWARKDNGSDIKQGQALNYCKNLRLAGFRDWRLPEIDELQQIYDPSVVSGVWSGNGDGLHVKGDIRMTGYCGWSATRGTESYAAWCFSFTNGGRLSFAMSFPGYRRALCVRRAGE
jgi:hypothetical protein